MNQSTYLLKELHPHIWSSLLNDLKTNFSHITHPTKSSPLLPKVIEIFDLNPDNISIEELLESKDFIDNQLLPAYKNLEDNLLPHLTFHNDKVTPKILATLTTDTYESLQNSSLYQCSNCNHLQMHDEDNCYECNSTTGFKEVLASETDYEFTGDDHCIEWEFLWSEWNDTLNTHFDSTTLEVHGYNLNWRGNDASKFIPADPKELHNLLSIGDEPVTLTINYDGTMDAVCAHHDATSRFNIFPTVSCCQSGEGIPYDEMEDAQKRAKLANALNESAYFEYLSYDSYVDEVTNIAHSFNTESLTYLLMEDMHTLTIPKIEYYLELDSLVSDND